MDDDLSKSRFTGQMFGVAVWVAVAAGAAVLARAGAPDAVVALFAVLALLGFVVMGVRATRR